ncbi:MAG: DHH family phosphoesterase [Nitrospirae bacterium]|nr:DHH family phosphoesterase [Nitrospirota bacterium]
MNRKWLVKRTNPEYIRYISKTASISLALAQILINRGIKTPQQINDFLNPKLSDLSDPFDLIGVKTAVERIKHAINMSERVLVHGDYDADGLTAAAIMVHTLRMHSVDVHYFIPGRLTHGYGFNTPSIDIAKKLGVKLIITVDCGITSFEAASYAKQNGIDVIITDHHEPLKRMQDAGYMIQEKNRASCIVNHASFVLPEAVAVVNPKLTPNVLRFTVLSGAGVAFKIAQALDSTLGTRHSESLLDLAAIGTIADVVPLRGENRVIVKEGMKLIREGIRCGIKTLKSASGLDNRELKAESLSFTVIPRLNAAGRIADSTDVVRLLLTDVSGEAEDLSLWLDRLNSERQRIEEEVYREASAKLNTGRIDSAIVLSGEGWHQGVVGIVASRIAEKYYRPTFIFSIEDGIAKGSARSIPSFDMCKGLAGCSEFLLSFGGHKQAAGIRLKVENIPDFERAIQDTIKDSLSGEDFIHSIEIDADITLTEANNVLVKELLMIEPLGHGNTDPFLGAKRLEVVNPRIVGNNHLKLKLKQGFQSIDAIGFDMGDSPLPDIVDAVFTLGVNEYNGNRYLQLNLKAIRPGK